MEAQSHIGRLKEEAVLANIPPAAEQAADLPCIASLARRGEMAQASPLPSRMHLRASERTSHVAASQMGLVLERWCASE